jgi:glutaminyl-tRNA synthetase
VLDNINVNFHPPQIEFSRLGLEYTVMSKRLLAQLVGDDQVSGWDDPRMPTLAGMRRRGIRPAAIRDFCGRIGVTKSDNRVEMSLLEFCVRQDLEAAAPRGMAVLDPLLVTLTNYPEGQTEEMGAAWHPQQPERGERQMPFGAALYIERDDFAEEPPPKYRRLTPGGLVRLRYGYIIRCDEVVKDADGRVTELRCSYVEESRSGSDTSGLKPKGVIHWVAVHTAQQVEVRLYDRLFKVAAPEGQDLAETLNDASLHSVQAWVEPAIIASDEPRFQFERVGYFYKDPEDSAPGLPVFNRIVTLRDSSGKRG